MCLATSSIDRVTMETSSVCTPWNALLLPRCRLGRQLKASSCGLKVTASKTTNGVGVEEARVNEVAVHRLRLALALELHQVVSKSFSD
jgi:hypothetical protein